MKNEVSLIFISVLSFFIFLPTISTAKGVELSLSSKVLTLYTTENRSLDIIIKNTQNVKDKFSITVFPSYQAGIIPVLDKYSLTLNPGENGEAKIYFEVPECAEEKSMYFSITVKSLTNDEVYDSKILFLEVIRKYGVCIYAINLSETKISPGKNISIEIMLMNPSESVSQPVYIETTIFLKNETLKKFYNYVEAVGGKKIEVVRNIFETSKYQEPGRYIVEIYLKDKFGSVLTKKATEFVVITVNASEKNEFLPLLKTTKYSLLSQTVEITVKNEGNVPTGSFYLSEEIPIFMKVFFFPEEEPKIEEIKENRVVYYWLVPPLQPGSSYTISYQISTWNAVLIAIVVIVIIVYIFASIFNITLVKTHLIKGPVTKEREITVMLEVKNRSRHEIKDVIIRDFVPSIATVIEKFDTLRPSLRKVTNGTELVWKIPSLAPGDERVLTYKIKPIVEIVGKLKLPKAYLKFIDRKKEVKKILSKSAYIKVG